VKPPKRRIGRKKGLPTRGKKPVCQGGQSSRGRKKKKGRAQKCEAEVGEEETRCKTVKGKHEPEKIGHGGKKGLGKVTEKTCGAPPPRKNTKKKNVQERNSDEVSGEVPVKGKKGGRPGKVREKARGKGPGVERQSAQGKKTGGGVRGGGLSRKSRKRKFDHGEKRGQVVKKARTKRLFGKKKKLSQKTDLSAGKKEGGKTNQSSGGGDLKKGQACPDRSKKRKTG